MNLKKLWYIIAHICFLGAAYSYVRLFNYKSSMTRTSLVKSALQSDKCDSVKLLKFDGGGIFFWYQAGACKYLQECGFSNHSNLSVLGTSAGALSATLLICECDFDKAADIAIDQCIQENLFDKPTGLMFKWGAIIEEWLNLLLSMSSNKSNEEFNQRLTRLIVTSTAMETLLPWRDKRQTFLTGFKDKDDLIDACMSSVHIPVFLDKKFYRKYYSSPRDGRRYDRYIDGSFWPYFGKLPTEVPRSLVQGCDGEEGVLSPQEIYVCGDWKADEDFMAKMRGDDTGFVSLVSPEGLFEMVKSGYEYMKREHIAGRVPLSVLPPIRSLASH